MLTRLKLQNFKSWRETGDVSLRSITGFFGSNSSGKTSLLQALLLLKQTAASSDRGQVLHLGGKGSLVDLGDFRTAVHGHDAGARIGIELDWTEREAFKIEDPTHPGEEVHSGDRMGFSARVSATAGSDGKALRMRVEQMGYRLGDVAFGMNQKAEDRNEYDLSVSGLDFQFIRTVGRPWPLPAPLKCYGFPDETRAYFQNAGFLADLEFAFERRLKGLYYLGPLRAYPELSVFRI